MTRRGRARDRGHSVCCQLKYATVSRLVSSYIETPKVQVAEGSLSCPAHCILRLWPCLVLLVLFPGLCLPQSISTRLHWLSNCCLTRMPLKLNGYSASVRCDGEELEHYDAKQDNPRTASCWIASESGRVRSLYLVARRSPDLVCPVVHGSLGRRLG